MASYSEQVVFCTGKNDWTSNIEQEEGETGDFVKGLKGVIGKGAPGFDVSSFFLFSFSGILGRRRALRIANDGAI